MSELARVLSRHACTLGEGIGLDAVTKRLRWFDIKRRQRLGYDFAEGTTSIVSLPEMASAAAAVDAAHELIFMQSGLWLRHLQSGALEPIAPIEADRPDLRSNDARSHPSGAYWCSTMALDKTENAGSIYWFFKGEVRRLYPGLTSGNAICFSEDGGLAYFSDTPKGTIWRVCTNPADGLPTGEPEVFDQASPGDPGGPDGAILDRDGFLYSARWGGARLDVFSPEGGRVRSIAVGGLNATCPAFCGPDLSSIAITTARDEMSEVQLADYPDSGRTFIVDVGCRGRLDPPVALG